VRDRWLREQGYAVLRFWNHEVLTNTEGVLMRIEEALEVSWNKA
jgi:very-short-patch-repair endonuclease